MNEPYQVKADDTHNRKQKRLINRMNRILRGDSSSKIRINTLQKLNLTSIINPKTRRALYEYKASNRTRRKVLPAVSIEEPEVVTKTVNKRHLKTILKKEQESKEFNRADIVKFIETFYKEGKTRSLYLTRYDNSKHRNKDANVPDFTSKDLQNDKFYSEFIKIKYAKIVLSPVSIYIRETYGKQDTDASGNATMTLPTDMKILRSKISNTIRVLSDKEKLKANQNTKKKLEITVAEIVDIFNKIADNGERAYPNMTAYDTDTLGALTAFYSYNGFRDDLGTLYVDPSIKIRKSNNYIDTKTGVVSIQPKKGKPDGINITLPKKNLDYIKMFIQKYPRKFVFVKKDTSEIPYGELDRLFTRLMKVPMGKSITIGNVRQAFVTFEKQSGDVNRQYNRAKMMAHSAGTATNTYVREG